MKNEQSRTKNSNVEYDEKLLYECLYKLKVYKYRIESIDNIQDLDVFISEFKNFIFDNNTLSEEYKKRIKDCSNYLSENNDILSKINRRIDKLVTLMRGYIVDGNDIENVFYFYSLRSLMGNYSPNFDITDLDSITIEDGMASFYYLNLVRGYLKNPNLRKIRHHISSFMFNPKRFKPIWDTIDFCVVNFENYITLNCVYWGEEEFFMKWLQSGTLGVICQLEKFLKTKLQQDTELQEKVSEKMN